MKIIVSTALAVAALAATHTQTTQAAYPADVAAMLDTTADPCDNFFQYACGGWLNSYTLPANRTSYAYSFNGISSRNDVVIQNIIKEDWPLIGELWDSCTATEALTALGNKPLQKDLNRINTASSKKDLARLAGELGTIGPSLFTGVGVGADSKDAKTNVLYAGSAGMVFTNPSYYTKFEAQFRKYISTLVTIANINLAGSAQQGGQGGGASKPVDTKYVEDLVLKIEKLYLEIQPTDEETEEYYSLTYSEAASKFPLSFGAMTQGFSLLEKASFTTSSKVVFDSVPFMERAEKLLNSLEVKDLKLYYSFLYVNAFAPYLGDSFTTATFELFDKTIKGAVTPSARTSVCTAAQTTFFPDLIGKYYFLKMFDTQRTQNVQLMVDAIEGAMGEHIARLSWLDPETRAQAADKLAKVANLIGQSTQKKSYAFALSRDNYFANVQAVRTNNFKDDLAKINKPVDRSEWGMSAATVNAYYSPSENKMVFPAAILQPPFYAGGVHPVQNFGAVGAVIGHELTHGFDSSGRHYDGDGNQREWWTSETSAEFESRATCMKKQYSTMAAYGDSGAIVGYVNGNLTIGENIADNGGVSLAFDAYHNWLASGPTFNDNGVSLAEAEKLFFLSFGQVWCGKIRDKTQLGLLSSDVHSPKPARVNGVAMNSDAFAKTFNCKLNTKMNPEKKCQLW